MNVIFISQECFPFAKASGLADLTYILAREIEKLEHRVKLFMPRYVCIDPKVFQIERLPLEYKVSFNNINNIVTVHKGVLPDSFASIYFIESQSYFANSSKIYLEDDEENLEREKFFSLSVIQIISKLKFKADIIHLFNTGSSHIAGLLKTKSFNYSELKDAPIVFTIHNLIGLNTEKLKAVNEAIRLSDFVTASSETFAEELKQDEHRFTRIGLSESLLNKKGRFVGILTGIDKEIYNPEKDNVIAQTYSKNYFSIGKKKCKESLLDEIGLEKNLHLPLFCFVSRLVYEKGIEMIVNLLPIIGNLGIQLVILGKGSYEQELVRISAKYKNVKVIAEYNHNLSKKIYAGSDFVLCPSKCEASSMSVLSAMTYGCIPVAHFAGAIKEILVDVDSSACGNGIVFSEYDEESLLYGINKAIRYYKNKEKWTSVVKAAMSFDFGSLNTAKKYVECYEKVGAGFKSAMSVENVFQ